MKEEWFGNGIFVVRGAEFVENGYPYCMYDMQSKFSESDIVIVLEFSEEKLGLVKVPVLGDNLRGLIEELEIVDDGEYKLADESMYNINVSKGFGKSQRCCVVCGNKFSGEACVNIDAATIHIDDCVSVLLETLREIHETYEEEIFKQGL